MNVNEIVDKIKLAIDLCNDGVNDTFTKEEHEEMFNFLDAQKMHEYGYSQWNRVEKPRWKEGDILAYYECTSDYEGEHILGEIIDVKLDENFDDWEYEFNDGYGDFEECLVEDECYTISKEYYEKHK